MAVKSEKKNGSKKQNQSQRDKIREKNRKKENKKRNKQIKEKYLSMVKRREFQIWAVTLILCFFGAIMIYSASSTPVRIQKSIIMILSTILNGRWYSFCLD